jgi:predicted restriction endonuclease
MAKWRDDVLTALQNLGGQGHLSEIYGEVRKVRGGLPPSWEAIVRRELEHNSTDSESYQGRHDLFRSAQGIGAGFWALREELVGERLVANDALPPPARVETTTQRIVRDTAIIRYLKRLHGDQCQRCGTVLRCDDGNTYSEGHHVRPLGSEHNGPDHADNVLILCPNCHALCDFGFVALEDAQINWHKDHRVRREYLDYHNTKIIGRKSVNID